MNRQGIVKVMAMLCVLPVICGGSRLEVKSLGGKIIFVSGKVEVLAAGTEDWTPAYKKTKLETDDKVRTGEKSFAEIVLLGDSILRLAPKTELTLSGEKKQGDFVAKVKVKFGRLWSNLANLTKKRSRMEVETQAAIIGVRGTVFNTDVRGKTTVSVYQGKVEVYNPLAVDETPIEGAFQAPSEVSGPGEIAPAFSEVSKEQWAVLLAENQRLVIADDGTQQQSDIDPEDDASDEWVSWNQERDGELGEAREAYIDKREAAEPE
jgi:hypothetical protein